MKQEILSDDNLARIVLNPRIDLYRKRRAGKPMKEVVSQMRQDLNIRFVQGPLSEGARPAVFAISFEYSDRYKAQAVVRQIVTEFADLNFVAARAAALSRTTNPEFIAMAERKVGEDLEVLDPANLPEAPVSPNRLAVAILGSAIGLALGMWLGRKRPPLAPRLAA